MNGIAVKTRHGKNPLWLRLIRWGIALTVLAALVYTVNSSATQIRALDFHINSIRFDSLVLAICCYAAAMFVASLFWKRVLTVLGCRTGWLRTFNAFFLSQLGKYVPGKAMVVLIRTDTIVDKSTPIGPAAASVFVETFTWLFVGSLIASILIAFRFPDQVALKWTAWSLAAGVGFLSLPTVFRGCAKRLMPDRQSRALDGLNFQTMLLGWFAMSCGWSLNGMSLWAVLHSLPGTAMTASDFLLAMACVSLATVAGFVSLLPGGLGVRELVMIPLLAPRFGSATAIIAAILIRLVWLSAEILCSGIIYVASKLASR